jgi:tetratricopeptide (TPR) repeat protein
MSTGIIWVGMALLVSSALAAQTAGQASNANPRRPTQQAEVASLAHEAQDALSREDWESAARDYQKLVAAAPRNAEFQSKLGMAFYSSGRPLDAIAPLRVALKLDPSLTSPRDILATSLAETGRCVEALPQLKKAALRVKETNLKRAVEVDGLRCAMSANQTDHALDFIKLLNRDFPRDPEALYLAVHVLSDLSIRASQELLVTAPASYQVHLLSAEALETQGRWDDAATEYREVLKKNPRLPSIHYRLGRLLLSKPKTATTKDEVRREFEEELKIDPNNAGAEYVLGELARQDEQWPAAIEHFGRAARLDAGFADALIGLGRSLIAGGRVAEAIAPLETAEKLQPDHPATHFHLATAYRRVGRKDDANREFALHQQTAEKARLTQQNIQAGVTGPQEVLGPQKAEP